MKTCPHCKTQNFDSARFCESCGKTLAPSAAPEAVPLSGLQTIDPAFQPKPDRDDKGLEFQPGHVFADRYRIIAQIGRGGMGVVYRAHDPVTERDVALKLIRGDRLAGKDAVKRLIREGVLARDIRHTNVVAVYDVGESGGLPYMSMEMLEGQSLRAWTQRRMRESRECSMATAANVVREILSGLQAAHAGGVIHRDLKPENVILTEEPSDKSARLKILDFGIARAGGGDTGSTTMGTLEYMAPEQLTAPDAVQPSADFYSLSVMFYELLIGVVPKGHWQPPSGGRSDVPAAIDKLIERGLSNNPRQRPQTAEQYRNDLEAAMAPTPQPQPQPRPKPQPQPQHQPDPGRVENINQQRPIFPPIQDEKPPSKNVRQLAMIGIGVVVLGVVGVLVATSGQNGQQQDVFDEPLTPPEVLFGQNQPTQPQVTPPFATTPPAPPLGATPNYTGLSGTWLDGEGGQMDVFVNGAGTATGTVRQQGDTMTLGMQGQFVGLNFNFVVGDGINALAFTGVMTDACHMRVYDPEAGENIQLHINHPPGAPCP